MSPTGGTLRFLIAEEEMSEKNFLWNSTYFSGNLRGDVVVGLHGLLGEDVSDDRHGLVGECDLACRRLLDEVSPDLGFQVVAHVAEVVVVDRDGRLALVDRADRRPVPAPLAEGDARPLGHVLRPAGGDDALAVGELLELRGAALGLVVALARRDDDVDRGAHQGDHYETPEKHE